MVTESNPKLTSAEMATLWTSYMNDTMVSCVFRHYREHVEDSDIRQVLELALNFSQQHIQKLMKIFKKEDFPIPQGFTEKDIDVNAPRLFTDQFILRYITHMGKFQSNLYTVALANAARSDIRQFFTDCTDHSMEIYNRGADVALSKGLFLKPPHIPTPQKVEFVQQQRFLNGWLGERRPLTAVEIMNLFFNLTRNALGKSLLLGFSQVARSKKVRDYMVRGKDIADKHVEVFGSILRENDLPVPMHSDSDVTESTIAPFSDKLMMFHTTALIAAGVGYYGTGVGTSPRKDISTQFVRLSAEIALYAEDGANIMIKNGWLEQPPTAPNRNKLTYNK